jgi:hypothetical protein
VDDIFTIHDQNKITPKRILEQFNAQYKNLKFTVNEEVNSQIEYLNLKLSNKQGQLEIEIYRKPTETDVTIDNTSYHPREHKLTTYKCWLDRLCKLPLNANNKRKELDIILNIAENNGYRKEVIRKVYNQLKNRQNNKDNEEKTNQKWVAFTYTKGHKTLQKHQYTYRI